MYTSGPKKVAIFPPGFNPAAGGPGGLGGAPKHMNAGANGHAPYAAPNPGANPLPGGAKAPLKGPPSMLPFEPKQPMAPPPKGPSPMHPKGPSTAPGYPPMHAPGATAAPGYALPKLPPPKQPSPPPFAARTSLFISLHFLLHYTAEFPPNRFGWARETADYRFNNFTDLSFSFHGDSTKAASCSCGPRR